MRLYLITNGEIKDGQIFVDYLAAMAAKQFTLPGETLTSYMADEEDAVMDENGVVYVDGGRAVDVCEWKQF